MRRNRKGDREGEFRDVGGKIKRVWFRELKRRVIG